MLARSSSTRQPPFTMPSTENLKLLLSNQDTVLFDSALVNPENRQSLLFTSPVKVLCTCRSDEVQSLLDRVDVLVDAGYYAAGYLAYEAGYAFDRWDEYVSEQPLAWFGIYQSPILLDQSEIRLLISRSEKVRVGSPSFSMTRDTYVECINRIRNYIREGDVYQVNFTSAFEFDYKEDPVALYQCLRGRQRVSYGAYINHQAGQILSFSPELFYRTDGDTLTTRPMKGTAPRGKDATEDQHWGEWLQQDEKNRAENVMIVDLLRNDLSRVCVPGSVKVPSLHAIETYETLFQMVSTVSGTLQKDVRTADLMRALFPGGSITGAPKLRAMEIIHELEHQPRGIYCGAIGFISPGQGAVFNIAIRTIHLQNGKGSMGAGSGIIWDSDPEDEYEECLLKGKFLWEPDV